jgi:Flp pilus assembly protein TadD
LFRQALARGSKSAAVQNNLAMFILRKGGDPEEAVALANKVVESNPHVASFYDTLGQAQSKGKAYAKAEEAYNAAIKLEPNNPHWQINLALVLSADGKKDQARAIIAPLEQLNLQERDLPPEAWNQLQKLRTELAVKQPG